MKARKKYIVLFLFLIPLATAAMITPKALALWHDKQTLGQLTYENMDCELYKISRYHSFADKLEAIASELSQGATLYQIKLRERSDAPENRELIAIIEKELKELHENGILPQEFAIQELEERNFFQAYVVPSDKNGTLLQDIYFWNIMAETEDGYIMLTMDSNYHKIYAVRIYFDMERFSDDTNNWLEDQSKDMYLSLAEAWCKYWELEEVEIDNNNLYEEVTYSNIAIDGVHWIGRDYGILFPEGHQFYEWSWLSNYIENGKLEVATWVSGMREISP